MNKIGIIGLGYVGLTLAIAFARKGIEVIGIEKNKKIYNSLKKGEAHFYEENLNQSLLKCIKNSKLKIYKDFKKLNKLNIIFITIGTPISKKNKLSDKNLLLICNKLKNIIKNDTIIALRSTVKINTCTKIEKLLNKKKKVHIASCPERTVEGKAIKELGLLPAIIGTNSKFAKEKLSTLFKKITKTIITFNNTNQAELLKLIDNSWRDSNFAFANELGRIGEYYKINVIEIIKKISLKYPRSKISMPGIVGGPCLSKDSHILNQSVKKINIPIIYNSRLTNEKFPIEMLEIIKTRIKKVNNILICGLAFKGIPTTSDVRGSMALPIINKIENLFKFSTIELFDNLVDPKDLKINNINYKIIKNYNYINNKYDLILILNNNPLWKNIGIKKLRKLLKKGNSLIYDFWNSFNSLDPQYIGFGQGRIFS